jgi:hypothetical protein
MSQNEEDLTRFDLHELIRIANELTQNMTDHEVTRGEAEKLRKLAEEIERRSPDKPAARAPAQVGFAKRNIQVPSRTKNLKPPGHRG